MPSALHGNPYDGHTLGPVIADLEKLTGVEVRRIHGDKGYRGHNHPDRFKVWITGQVRRVTKAIRREMRRRAAVEPVIGHLKDDHRMGRNHLKGREGDRINAVLAAAGYNFSPGERERSVRELSIFDAYSLNVIARRAAEHSLFVVSSVRLDRGNPHCRKAFRARIRKRRRPTRAFLVHSEIVARRPTCANDQTWRYASPPAKPLWRGRPASASLLGGPLHRGRRQ